MYDNERYTLALTDKPEIWVIIDNVERIQITFKENEFNETQQVEYLPGCKLNQQPIDVIKIARTLRCMSDFLMAHHSHIAV